MKDQELQIFGGFSVGLILLTLLSFAVLKLLQIPVGTLVDWLIGMAMFWWLLVIVTVPWNIYFQAKQVLQEAQTSQKKSIRIDPQQQEYVLKVAFWSLRGAIALHLITAISLYFLAFFQIISLGYAAALAALLLTCLRPAIRGYEYLRRQMFKMEQEFLVPRQDAVELGAQLHHLREHLRTLQRQVVGLETQLNPADLDSWAHKQQVRWQELSRGLAELGATVEAFQASNQQDHQRLSQEARQSVAQLREDSQFLEHVREIIRFIKGA